MQGNLQTPTFHPVFFEFNTPAAPTDVNLVEVARIQVAAHLGNIEATLFVNDPSIMAVCKIIPSSQRLIINKYFTSLLMQFRADKAVNVIEVSQYLINDGTHEDWAKLFNEIVMPFFKEHKVFNVVYNLK